MDVKLKMFKFLKLSLIFIDIIFLSVKIEKKLFSPLKKLRNHNLIVLI